MIRFNPGNGQSGMSVSITRRLRQTCALFALLASGFALSGCGSVGDTISPAFADPGKYQLWDCKRHEGERKNLANRTEELQKLMDKAKTGVGGSVVAEMAYRDEYVAVRGQAHFADEAWNSGKCSESAPEGATPSPAPAPKASKP
jgi:hypothetical protein